MKLSKLLVAISAAGSAVLAEDLLTDISKISRYWGQISPYADNPENYFGVDYIGLPEGCQIASSAFRKGPYRTLTAPLGISSKSPTPCPEISHKW
jgi:hypothetical protein